MSIGVDDVHSSLNVPVGDGHSGAAPTSMHEVDGVVHSMGHSLLVHPQDRTGQDFCFDELAARHEPHRVDGGSYSCKDKLRVRVILQP